MNHTVEALHHRVTELEAENSRLLARLQTREAELAWLTHGIQAMIALLDPTHGAEGAKP